MPNITVYAIILLAAAVLASAFVLIVIIPKFEEIFRDFDTALPLLMIYFINTSNWLVTAPGIWFLSSFLRNFTAGFIFILPSQTHSYSGPVDSGRGLGSLAFTLLTQIPVECRFVGFAADHTPGNQLRYGSGHCIPTGGPRRRKLVLTSEDAGVL